jgi:hypothetical protein
MHVVAICFALFPAPRFVLQIILGFIVFRKSDTEYIMIHDEPNIFMHGTSRARDENCDHCFA